MKLMQVALVIRRDIFPEDCHIQELPKKMYTHFNRWYLYIVFEVELNYHYNMWYGVFSTDVATR